MISTRSTDWKRKGLILLFCIQVMAVRSQTHPVWLKDVAGTVSLPTEHNFVDYENSRPNPKEKTAFFRHTDDIYKVLNQVPFLHDPRGYFVGETINVNFQEKQLFT